MGKRIDHKVTPDGRREQVGKHANVGHGAMGRRPGGLFEITAGAVLWHPLIKTTSLCNTRELDF